MKISIGLLIILISISCSQTETIVKYEKARETYSRVYYKNKIIYNKPVKKDKLLLGEAVATLSSDDELSEAIVPLESYYAKNTLKAIPNEGIAMGGSLAYLTLKQQKLKSVVKKFERKKNNVNPYKAEKGINMNYVWLGIVAVGLLLSIMLNIKRFSEFSKG